MKITILEDLAVAEDKLREMARYITDQGHELEIFMDKESDQEKLKERVEDTDLLIIANSPLSGEVIRAGKNLKYIAVAFTGVDHVDLETCNELGIKVSNAAGYSTSSVAELAFGLMIDLYRNILPLDQETRNSGTKDGFRQRDLYGKKLGVIGTGDIGSHVINIGLAFGCEILAYSRTEKEELKDRGVRYLGLDQLLSESDIVTIHLPQNNKTKGLIGSRELGLMKKDSILINTARGPIVDNDALADALNQGLISGAGIDVFDIEPPLNKDYKLLSAKNTVLAPHVGFATEEAMVRRAEISFDNIDSFIRGEQKNIVL